MVALRKLVVLSLATVGSTQVAWHRLEVLTPRDRPGLAQLPGGAVTLFGGSGRFQRAEPGQTWEWSGTRWTRRLTATTPPAGGDAIAVTDTRRGRIVALLSGGSTWTWDGHDWQAVPGPQPTQRSAAAAMAYDAVRDRVVLFGGLGARADGVWEFDGTQWAQIPAATQPGARDGAAMTYDQGRQRVVLFGGGSIGAYGDTWEWDGSTWQQVATAGPFPRRGHALTYDPSSGSTLLFGGVAGLTAMNDLWSWDGRTWTEIVTAHRPAPRGGAAMVFAAATGRVLMTGGLDTGDTWSFDGVDWQRLAEASAPPPVARGAMATTPAGDGVVLQVGDACWSLRRGEWQREASGPSRREKAAMALDSQRGRVVLFGGYANNAALGDTWQWDGHAWAAASVSGPPARLDHAMAFDAARGRVVLFGGGAPGTYFNDTWEWDGATWTLRSPGTSPSARTLHGMAYDAVRRETVLFGGNGPAGASFETWTYDGSAWQQRAPAHTPDVAHGYSALVWDDARARVVLCGDRGNVWEWDGSEWTPRVTEVVDDQLLPALAYDPLGAVIVALGDAGNVGGRDAYLYGPVRPARVDAYGTGCGPQPQPRLVANGRPWLGDVLSLTAESLPANAGVIAFILGASDRAWLGLALPLPLTSLGMDGCALLASPEVMVAAPAVLGGATIGLAVPAVPALAGMRLFAQTLTPAPGANPRGLVTTAALALQLGGR